MPKIFENKLQMDIIRDYSNGFSSGYLSKKYDVSRNSILRICRRNNIKIKPSSSKKRKYEFNQDYFSKIDTEEKAYFLGLMYADGYNDNKSRVSISLEKQDKYILEKFQNDINIKNKLYISKPRKKNWQNMFTLSIFSKKVSQDLITLGCFRNKSLTLKFPTENQIPKHLLRHFIRGYFDGDGCISCMFNKNYKSLNNWFSILGSEDFCKSISSFLSSELCIIGKIRQKSKIWEYYFRKISDIDKIFFYFYENSSLYLTRKYEKFIFILSNIKRLSNEQNIRFRKQ